MVCLQIPTKTKLSDKEGLSTYHLVERRLDLIVDFVFTGVLI